PHTSTPPHLRQYRHTPPAGPAPRMRRSVELSLVVLGMITALITQGGFTLVMNGLDQPTFEEVVMPFLVGEDSGLSGTEARLLGEPLAAWLGMSLGVRLLLAVPGVAPPPAGPCRR